jgi:hypothetical protein
MTRLLPAIVAVVSTCVVLADGGLAETASRNESRLIVPGLHEVGDFVYASASRPVPADSVGLARTIAGERAELDALVSLVRLRPIDGSLPASLPVHIREACVEAAARCSLGSRTTSIVGATLVIDRHIDGAEVRVIGMTKSAFDALRAEPFDLPACLMAAASECGLSDADAFLLLEIVGAEGGQPGGWDAIRPCLVRKFGVGIAMMAGGTWDVGSAAEASAATSLWIPSLAAAIVDGGSEKGADPVDAAKLGAFGMDELLAFAGHRANDPVVRQELLKRFRAMGFARSAELVCGPGCPARTLSVARGFRLGNEIRKRIISVPVVALSVLSGGSARWPASADVAKDLIDKVDSAMQQGNQAMLDQSVVSLAEALTSSPEPRGLKALGRVLMASGDPELAAAAFAAAYRAAADDDSALGALQAWRSLGDRDQARAFAASLGDDLRHRLKADHPDWSECERWLTGQP